MLRESFTNLCLAWLQKKWEPKFRLLSMWRCWSLGEVTFGKHQIQLVVERKGLGSRGSGIIRKVLGTVCYIFLVLESPATATEWAHSPPREHLGHWVITFLWSDSAQQLDTFINFTTWSLGALCFLFNSAGELEEYGKYKSKGNWKKEQSTRCWKAPC